MRLRRGATALAALFLLTGCTSDGATTAAKPYRWSDDVQPAAAEKPVAGCEIPVKFDLAKGWKPKPVKLDGGLLDDLAKQGDATLACEIDAKPAGHIGFLRVWLTPANEGRQTLASFMAADQLGSPIEGATYRDVQAGGATAAEVIYDRVSDDDARKHERALAVPTKDGTAILVLSGLDNGEFFAMLPAYVLARKTMTT